MPAAWMGRPALVMLLLEHGSPVDTSDGNGRTPLMLAIRACVNSYWTSRRSPDAVETLLAAGASTAGIAFPTDYDAIDEVLEKYL